jgi:putative ABC transport system permease protein
MRHALNWRRYVRFWGPNVDADIDDELRFHLDARIAEYERLGFSSDEAARLTRQRVGELTEIRARLRHHDARRLAGHRHRERALLLTQDVRYGARRLLHDPGFSLAIVVVLALGIGLNTAVYSAIDAVFLRPLPYPHADRLVQLGNLELEWSIPGVQGTQSYPYVRDIEKLPAIGSVAAYAVGGLNLEDTRTPTRVSVAHVTIDFFRTMGRAPSLGRAFIAEEESPGGPAAVVLSNHLWRTQFGGDPNIAGRDIRLNARAYRVVGVMPADFDFPSAADLWAPLPMPLTSVPESFKSYVPEQYVARLAPGVTVRNAARQLADFERRYSGWTDMSDTTQSGIINPLQRALLPTGARRPLVLVMASAALVLLIAIVNVTNLLLSRATTRRRELGVRTALGATRARLVRQLTSETLLLTGAGAVLGTGLAWFSIHALRVFVPPDLLTISPPSIDPRVLAFAIALSVVIGLAVGVWPAVSATRLDAGDVIKSGDGRGATARRGTAARNSLVVVEVALAVTLLIGAALMLESFRALMNTESGLDTSHVTTAQMTLPYSSYHAPDARAFYDQVLERLRATDGVAHAAAVNALPLAVQARVAFRVTSLDGRPLGKNAIYSGYMQVTPDYFATMGIPVLLGRDIAAGDDSSDKVLVINHRMATRLWPGQNPIGRHLSVGNDRRTIVGVVGDVRSSALDQPTSAEMYFPFREVGGGDANIVVRGNAPPAVLAQRIRATVRSIDASQVVYNVQSMDDVLDASVAPRRANTLLLAIFGAVALALAVIGVYAVLAFAVAQRTREFGVRLALGAREGDLLALVVKRGALLAASGAALGIVTALALSRFIESVLYGVGARDMRAFVVAPSILLVVAIAATLVPAIRATRVDPLTALREE